MGTDKFLTEDDLVYNTATRIPVCLCIDTSGSMKEKNGLNVSKLDRVKLGIKKFFSRDL